MHFLPLPQVEFLNKPKLILDSFRTGTVSQDFRFNVLAAITETSVKKAIKI